MPYSGSGTWSNVYDWNQDAAAGIKILASRQQTQWNDTASNGLSNVICKDGQTTTTAVIPFAAGISIGGGATISNFTQATWTPTDASGAGLSLTVVRATSVRLGSIYYCDMEVTYPATADGTAVTIGGLPGTWANVTGVGGTFAVYDGVSSAMGFPVKNTATFVLFSPAGVPITNANVSGKSLYAQFMLFTV